VCISKISNFLKTEASTYTTKAMIRDLELMVGNAKAFNQRERHEWRLADEFEYNLALVKDQLRDI
jgi:hypothetical protein